MEKILFIGLIGSVFCLGVLFCGNVFAAEAPRSEYKRILREILREDPSLVLDVLRENSETVLDIAQQGADQRHLRTLKAQWSRDIDNKKTVNLANRPVRGAANAPVTIVAFSDFTCPYCRQSEATVNAVLARYGDKARLIFKNFPLEGRKNARLAAQYHVAATLQDAEKSWKFYDLLFAENERIGTEGDAFLQQSAAQAGLDVKALMAELKKGVRVNAILEEDAAEARAFGIEGAPNFLVNNLMIRGALPLDFFIEAVNMAYDAAVAKK
jgi:protein-disulfide isomerase